MAVAALVFAGWVLAVCLHEFGHALVAYFGGDRSVKDKGYLTFNILKYTDPQMTFVFPLIILMLGGIALPGAAVYINRGNLRNRAWQSAVSAAGPIATVVAAVLFALPFMLGLKLPMPQLLLPTLAFLVLLQFISALYNSLPVPGFDGFGVIEPWLPDHVQEKASQYGSLGIWLVFLAIWTIPAFGDAVLHVGVIGAALLNVDPRFIALGAHQFQEQRYWLAAGLVVAILLSRRKKQPEQSAQDLYRDALARFKANDTQGALNGATEALQRDHGLAEAWHLRALCLGILDRNEDALPCFDAAVQLRPDFADAWYNKACCHALLGQQDDAMNSLQQALQLSPDGKLQEHARKEAAFRSLQADSRFTQLVAPIEQRNQ